MTVSRTVSETLSVGVTLKTVLQSTAKTVVPTKSYQILNRFSLNGHFRHAVYVVPECLLEIASDDRLSCFDRIPA